MTDDDDLFLSPDNATLSEDTESDERLRQIRERKADRAAVRQQFARRRARGLSARHAAKLARLAESWEFPTIGDPSVGLPTIGHPTDIVPGVGVQRSTETPPDLGQIKALLVREAARSTRRSQAVRRSLAARDLAPWLTTVDSEWPGLLDTERLRLADILRRHLAATTTTREP